jgi:acetyl/propionyl-CoA carboxylase alpha subunit
VREQIRTAAGEALTLKQENVWLRGCAIQCRINAEDPWQNFMPSPGHLSMVRLPGGFGVRVDTYVYSGASVPARYDPLVAKLIVWGETREECMRRIRRALEDFALTGVVTNLPLHQSVLNSPILTRSTSTIGIRSLGAPEAPRPETYFRDLAAVVAVAYAQRSLAFRSSLPERLQSGWHRASRELPH